MTVAGLLGFSKQLGPRFNFISLLPAGLLVVFVSLLLASGAPGSSPDLARVTDKVENLDAWQGVLLFLGVLALTLIVEPLQVSLVRVLEGYWTGSVVGSAMARPAIRFHERRQKRLTRDAEIRGADPLSRDQLKRMREATDRLRDLYYSAELLPTKLGNVLRSAESRAGTRYGLEALVVWPRLYPLLSPQVVAIVDDRRDQLDLAARFCAVFLIASATSAVLLVGHGWWLALAVLTLVLASLSYRSAVAAAVAYGQSLEAAFDLHRFDLLKALRMPLPENSVVEKASNMRLSSFLMQNGPLNFIYDHEKADSEASRE